MISVTDHSTINQVWTGLDHFSLHIMLFESVSGVQMPLKSRYLSLFRSFFDFWTQVHDLNTGLVCYLVLLLVVKSNLLIATFALSIFIPTYRSNRRCMSAVGIRRF